MNISSPKKETRNIYEKTLKLLSDSQSQLNTTRRILKKTVTRLTMDCFSSNDQVDKILNEIKNSSHNEINLDALDFQLDQFFALYRQSYNQQKLIKHEKLYLSLQDSLYGFDCTESCKSLVNVIVDKKLSDKDTLLEILKCINNTDTICNKSENDALVSDIDFLIREFSSLTGFVYVTKAGAHDEVMQDFVKALTNYIHVMKSGGLSNIETTQSNCNDNNALIVTIFKNFINDLSLPQKMKQQQIELLKIVNNPASTDDFLMDIAQKASDIINQSLSSLQSENIDSQNFISKINKQLIEIKSYMERTRQDSSEAVNRSVTLQESVNTSVDYIQEKVTSATNVAELKKDIANQLKEIRNNVEENKLIEKHKADVTTIDYSQMIDELASTQLEASKLREELNMSKMLLLHDSLTGLYNRAAYEERILLEYNRHQRTKAPLSIAMWDIDHFKNVNDSYGHDVGDKVLKIFSDLISSRIRKTDMFARIGGEEFVLLMPDTSVDNAQVLNNKLREQLVNCSFTYKTKRFPVTASVGLAEFNDKENVVSVKKKADQALYHSKRSGRNRCTIYNDGIS